jgi:RNase H-fold protein (predicted Holliday junction resolvase)
MPIVLVDERYSTLEARDRYWQMYPPKGIERLIPQGLRQPPRPIDDIVAILLIERYLELGSGESGVVNS